MTPIFKLGPGAPIGSGGKFVAEGQPVDELDPHRRHRRDLSAGSRKRRRAGPVNGTAPNPVRNAEFAKTFSSVLEAVHALAGLSAVRAARRFAPARCWARWRASSRPGRGCCRKKALALGYQFKYPHLADALRAVVEQAAPAAEPEPVHAAAGRSIII